MIQKSVHCTVLLTCVQIIRYSILYYKSFLKKSPLYRGVCIKQVAVEWGSNVGNQMKWPVSNYCK